MKIDRTERRRRLYFESNAQPWQDIADWPSVDSGTVAGEAARERPEGLAEAARLGFTVALTPAQSEKVKAPAGLQVRPCSDIVEAMRSVLPLDK